MIAIEISIIDTDLLMTKKNKSRLPFMVGVDYLSRHMAFILFLGGLSVIYIGNVHRTTRTIRGINQAKAELVKTRNVYLATKCDLIKSSQQSEVAEQLANSGFKDKHRAPVKILASR